MQSCLLISVQLLFSSIYFQKTIWNVTNFKTKLQIFSKFLNLQEIFKHTETLQKTCTERADFIKKCSGTERFTLFLCGFVQLLLLSLHLFLLSLHVVHALCAWHHWHRGFSVDNWLVFMTSSPSDNVAHIK